MTDAGSRSCSDALTAQHLFSILARDFILRNNLFFFQVLTAIKSRETVHAQIYDRLSSRMAELDDKLEEVTRLRRASDPQTCGKIPTMTKASQDTGGRERQSLSLTP